MNDDRLRDITVAHGDAVLALVHILADARSVQWDVPPGAQVPHVLDFADTTGEVTVNADRLRLRAAVEDGLLTIRRATAALEASRTRVEEALDRYVSPPTPPAVPAA